MKRSLLAAALISSAASVACAEPVALTDAQMDQVYAGTVIPPITVNVGNVAQVNTPVVNTFAIAIGVFSKNSNAIAKAFLASNNINALGQ